MWYNVRRYRLTTSRFGEVFHCRVDTRPDALVLRLLQQKQIFSPAIEWGIEQESTAIAAYTQYQHDIGKSELSVCLMGFTICHQYPFLGATPDGGIYDPTEVEHPFGLLEVKINVHSATKSILQLRLVLIHNSVVNITMVKLHSKIVTPIFVRYKARWLFVKGIL